MKTNRRSRATLHALYELFSSMRFAVALLTLLAIASIIGTVLKQNELYSNYAFEFGQYWFKVFETLGLYDVYHASWFIAILAFLVLSLTLCILRNAPGFMRDMRTFRSQANERSLMAMKHTVQINGYADIDTLTQYLQQQKFRCKTTERPDGRTLIAAKKGSAHRLGYFFAHGALILICLGGLIDGNLPLKIGEWLGHIVPEIRDLPQSQIPAASRLSSNNLSFRGNVTISENKSADVVFINAGPGYLVQELPFIVTLRRFIVDYYSNGMPKLFASDIEVTDKASNKTTHARIEVNHPLIINGIAIYQASFGDGGSPIKLKAWHLNHPQTSPTLIHGTSNAKQSLSVEGQDYQLEFNDLRVFNIEDMSTNNKTATDLEQRLKDAREVKREHALTNVGPSISFKLRNNAGLAREYLTYMAPIQQDGASYLITGVRKEVSQPFDYLRIPRDDHQSIDSFMRFRAAMMNPTLYNEIAKRSSTKAMQGNTISPNMRQAFETSVKWVLARFAENGFNGLQSFLTQQVPADKRQEVAQTYLKILQGTAIDVMDVANRHAGLAPMAQDASHYHFLLDSLIAISALKDYGAPVFLELTGFQQVQASGLQITRSPGKSLVYFGALLLIAGIFLMFYIQDRRLWLLAGSENLRLAMSANRQSLALEQDFKRHQHAIQQLVRGQDGHRSNH